MNNNKLNILFVLQKNRINKQNTCPIRCRITFQQKRKIFSTGLSVNPDDWNTKLQRAEPPDKEHHFINTQLSLISSKLNQAFLMLQINKPEFTIDDLYNQYKGENTKTDVGVLESYKLFLNYLEKLIGKELNQATYQKYVSYGLHLNSFVKWKYHVSDVKLSQLKSSFITHYEYYLKTEKQFVQTTLNKVIQRFRRAIRYAIAEGFLEADPFMLYKAKRVKKEITYLTKEELDKLEKYSFKIPRIQQIKDMFVFCCYTGLAFKEMTNLSKNDIVKEFDGNFWLHIRRAKTTRIYKIPLLRTSLEIIERYTDDIRDGIFPKISNPKFNAYLKEIADILGFKINLTHHVARRTFATTVLLYNDVPMEIVSKLLGHAKMQTTQEHYGQIVQKKISEHMTKLSEKLK